jgi:hypothetical protein
MMPEIAEIRGLNGARFENYPGTARICAVRLDLDQNRVGGSIIKLKHDYNRRKIMSQEQMTSGTAGKNPTGPIPPAELARLGQQTIDSMMDMQKGFMAALSDVHQHWISAANAQAALASELLTKLAGAKSIPEAATAYQSCANRQMEILAESGRQLAAAGEKLMPQLFTNGFKGGAGT